MTLAAKMATLYRMLERFPMQHDGRELSGDEKLGVMYRQFPKTAEEIFLIPPTQALAVFQKQIDLVTLYKRHSIYRDVEKGIGGDAA